MNTGKIVVAPNEVMDKLVENADAYAQSGEFITEAEIGQIKLKRLHRESGKIDSVWYLDCQRIGMRDLKSQLEELDSNGTESTGKTEKKDKKKNKKDKKNKKNKKEEKQEEQTEEKEEKKEKKSKKDKKKKNKKNKK